MIMQQYLINFQFAVCLEQEVSTPDSHDVGANPAVGLDIVIVEVVHLPETRKISIYLI